MSYAKKIRFTRQKLPYIPVDSAASVVQRESAPQLKSRTDAPKKSGGKSKLGCKTCKARRIKCDETYPVCRRCLKRGSICLPAARSQQWICELTPDLSINLPSHPHIDKKSLEYWLEKASYILVTDTENNPWSYPILRYLDQSPALAHAIQSLSIGHRTFFDETSRFAMLEQRELALTSLRHELADQDSQIYLPAFLTAYLLMVSTAGLDMNMADYGQKHFAGARALLCSLLLAPNALDDESLHLLLGYYVYCDMSISFLMDPEERIPSNNEQIHSAIGQTRHMQHPLVGFSMEIIYLMGTIGKHCRRVLDTGEKDAIFEATIEEQILDWVCSTGNSMLDSQSHVFRDTALILLYRICGCQPRTFQHGDGIHDSDAAHLETVIRKLALQVIQTMDSIPPSSCYSNILPLPLVTAGSELGSESSRERSYVLDRLRALYSFNRIPINLMAIELLNTVWRQRDQGGPSSSWISVMLSNNWKIAFC
jgi:hypothetical protein